MMDLSVSDLYIKVGNIGFERTWMQKLEANAPHSIIVDSSEGVTPLRTPHGDIDPHTWMSVVNARIIARNICQALVQLDSKDSIYFQDNLKQNAHGEQDTLVSYLSPRAHLFCTRLQSQSDSDGGGGT